MEKGRGAHRLLLLFFWAVVRVGCSSFDDFNPKTTTGFLTYTITVSGSGFTTADQISVVRDSVTGNASTVCGSNGGSVAQTVGGPVHFYQTSNDGTGGTATMTITEPGSHRVCGLAGDGSTWTGIGQFNILTTDAPTISGFATINPNARTSSGSGNNFRALTYHPFELSLTGSGLVAGSSVELAWFRGQGCNSNQTQVTGGAFRGLSTANNDGTSGTVAFTLTDAPQNDMSLCLRYAGGSSRVAATSGGGAVVSATLVAPSVSGWSVSPFTSSTGSVFTVLPNTELNLQFSGSNLLGEDVQRPCAEAGSPFFICVKIATSCADASDVSDLVGGDAVVPAMNSTFALRAQFSFSIPSGTTTGVVCTRSAGGGSWAEVAGRSIDIEAPSVSGHSPTSVSSNAAFTLAINGTLFFATGADAAKVKLATDCSANTLLDSVAVVQGGAGRVCDSVVTFADGSQQCRIQYASGIAALVSTTVQVCLRYGSGAYSQASASGSGFSISLSPISATGATLPALITSNSAVSITITGQALSASGDSAVKLKLASDCAVDSGVDASDIPGGDGTVLSSVTGGTTGVASFTIAVATNQSVVVCWAVVYSLSYSQVGASVPVDAVTVSSFSPAAAFSMRQFSLQIFGTKLAVAGATAVKVKVAFDCSLDTESDDVGVVLGGAGFNPSTLTGTTQASSVIALSTMLSVPEAQLCWRIGSRPYQRVGTGVLSVAAASATSFTPTAATSFAAVTLTVSGSFGLQGDPIYAKMATDCRTNAYGDATGTVPGSEAVAAQKFSSSFLATFTMAALSTTSLQLCWRAGSSPFVQVGTGTLTLSPIGAAAITPSVVVSNVPTQVTITGTGFVSTPSNLLVRLKLSEDCALYADSDRSTCGTGYGDCVFGGTGVAQAGTADGQFGAVFDVEAAVFNTVNLQLCWTMNTPPYQYVPAGSLAVEVQVPTVQVSAIAPSNPFVNEPFTLSLVGEGLSGHVPVKLKLSRLCDGLLDQRSLQLVDGGDARYFSCITDSTAASVSFTVLSDPAAYSICFASGEIGNSGSWRTADTSLIPSLSFNLQLPTVIEAAVESDAPLAANIPFTVTFAGRGFGAGEKVKVKVVSQATNCGFPFAPSGGAGCSCDSAGRPSGGPQCACAGSNSDFAGVVAGGEARLVAPLSTREALVSLAVFEVGDFTLCWSAGDLSRTGTAYLPALNFSAFAPYASCAGPTEVFLGAPSQFAVVGYGLTAQDRLKLVWTADGSCDADAIPGLEGTSSASVDRFGTRALFSFGAATESYTQSTFWLCYQFANSRRGFVRVGNLVTALEAPVVASVSPSRLFQLEPTTLSIVGAGLSSRQEVKLVRFNQQCSAASPTLAGGGDAVAIACAASATAETSEVTCTAQFAISQAVSTSAAQNSLRVCYSYTPGAFVEVGAVELRLPSVSGVAPSQALAGAGTTVTVTGEGFRSTLAKALKFVAMHAECGGTSAVADAVAGGQALALPVAADASSLLLPLSFLPASAGPARVCFQAGSQNFRQVALIDVVSPAASSAAPLLYGLPTPRSAVPAAVPFQLSVQGIGLAAPGILVKIIPATSVCEGSINPDSEVVSGGAGKVLVDGLASFAGITDVGSVKACFLAPGRPEFVEVPSSAFVVTSSFTTASVFPTSIVQGIATRIELSGTGLIPSRLGLSASIRQTDCQTGAVLPGGEDQAVVDDDSGQGRKVYLAVTVSNADPLATYKLCLFEFGVNATEVSTLSILTQPAVIIHQTTAPVGVPFQIALSGVGLSTAGMLKFIRPTAVCSGLAGTTSQNASIVTGGQARSLLASSVAATATAAVSRPATIADIGSIKACYAAGPGLTFADMQTAGSTSPVALLAVAEYQPAMESDTAAGSRMSLVRGAPASFVIYGVGVQAGDSVVVSRDPCPSTTPSQDVLASFDAVAGGQARQFTASNATSSTCGFAGFRATFWLNEVGAGFHLCYIPAGFGVSIPLEPDTVDVELPTLHSLMPKLTYANRRQVYTLSGSGGYRPGDKVKLVRAYGGSGFSPTISCASMGITDESDIAGGEAYEVAAGDVAGPTLRVEFTVAEAWVAVRMCYLPAGGPAYQAVGTVDEMLQVRAPQTMEEQVWEVIARDDVLLPVHGNGLSTDDRFKIIPAEAACSGTDDELGSVSGGEGRNPASATSGGNRVEVAFTLSTSAIGPARVCFRHTFSCEYANAGPLSVMPPVVTALGDARQVDNAIRRNLRERAVQDGNMLNEVLVNRDSVIRVNGIGLSNSDVLRVVALTSPCQPPAGNDLADDFESFGEGTLFSVNANRSSALVRLNLESDKVEGRLCFRFCDQVGCGNNSNPFVDTSIVLPLVQPLVSAVTPESLQVDEMTSVTITGTSLTPRDRVKIVEVTQPCAGFDDHLGILTGGNGLNIVPQQDCNLQPNGNFCTAVATFTMTFEGYGKLCFHSYGGPGYREVVGSEGNIEVCTGICLSAIDFPDIGAAAIRQRFPLSLALPLCLALIATIASWAHGLSRTE